MNDTVEDRVWGVAERVTRLEQVLQHHAEKSEDFRTATNARMDRLDAKMTGIDGKLDTVISKITTAETVVGGGVGLVRWLGRQAPSAGIGGFFAWLATHFLGK